MRILRPKVIANFAITTDGKVSTRNHTPTGFTSAADKRRLQEIRALSDALLVGRNTVETDNMSMGLSAHDLREKRLRNGLTPVPLRAIVSNSGAINPKWKIFRSDASPVVLFTRKRLNPDIRSALPDFVSVHPAKGKSVSLRHALQVLHKDYGVRAVTCEGGPTLFRSLLEENCVDEIFITVAGLIFVGAGAPTLTGLPSRFLSPDLHLRLLHHKRIGSEFFLHYAVKRLNPSRKEKQP